MTQISTENIILRKTGDICPEQYDAYYGDQMIGYLRVRHGNFSVHWLSATGESLFSCSTKGDGAFTDYERHGLLLTAKAVLAAKYNHSQEEQSKKLTTAWEEVESTITGFREFRNSIFPTFTVPVGLVEFIGEQAIEKRGTTPDEKKAQIRIVRRLADIFANELNELEKP